MINEYVKLSDPEIAYGKKNLLQTQLGLINIQKEIKNYKEIRKAELILKMNLKTKLTEINNSILLLEKVLPKVNELHIEKKEVNLLKENNDSDKELSLERELDLIKKKLSNIK